MSKHLKLSTGNKPLPTSLKKHLERSKLPKNSNYLLKSFANISLGVEFSYVFMSVSRQPFLLTN